MNARISPQKNCFIIRFLFAYNCFVIVVAAVGMEEPWL